MSKCHSWKASLELGNESLFTLICPRTVVSLVCVSVSVFHYRECPGKGIVSCWHQVTAAIVYQRSQSSLFPSLMVTVAVAKEKGMKEQRSFLWDIVTPELQELLLHLVAWIFGLWQQSVLQFLCSVDEVLRVCLKPCLGRQNLLRLRHSTTTIWGTLT